MAERADRAIFVTSGVYTREAIEFAIGKPIQLIDGAALCQLIDPVRRQPSGIDDAMPSMLRPLPDGHRPTLQL